MLLVLDPNRFRLKGERMTQGQSGLLQAFYLLASAKSWAGGGAKTTIPELPGSKVITVEEGSLRYVDLYYTYPGSEESFGQTVIWIHDGGRQIWLPAWGMQFGGSYPERVIVFLKAALQQAYEAKEFIGGRDPRQFVQGDLVYENFPRVDRNSFDNFLGKERILEVGVGRVGFHWYRGHLLIPRT